MLISFHKMDYKHVSSKKRQKIFFYLAMLESKEVDYQNLLITDDVIRDMLM